VATIAEFVDRLSGAARMNTADRTVVALETGDQRTNSPRVFVPSREYLCRLDIGIGDVAGKRPEGCMEVGDAAVDVGDI
jgi:hypothetical protein